MNPTEAMKERIVRPAGAVEVFDGKVVMYNLEVDPTKLAAVLVELQEQRAPVEHCGVEDCPECNQEAYKTGYEAALRDVEEKVFKPCLDYCVTQNGRDDCKNCGLDYSMLASLRDTQK